MKRHWLRIHLSTALVMMLVAAAFVGVNATPMRRETVVGDQGEYHGFYYGWPCELCLRYTDRAESFLYRSGTGSYTAGVENFSIRYFVVNVLVCAGAALGLGVALEWRLRRGIKE